MPRSFFRISVIDGALNICEHRLASVDVPLEQVVAQLRRGSAERAGYDYERAIELAKLVGWDAFCLEGTRRHQLRQTLKLLLFRLRPLWARTAFQGRRRFVDTLPLDQAQCFEVAGLLEARPSEDVITWWQDVARFFRGIQQNANLETGRIGERLTLEYERTRLLKEGIKKEPIWVAFEDETRGFDVLSFQRSKDGAIEEIQIEVKASKYSPVEVFLSCWEWSRALQYPDTYLFHIWDLQKKKLVKRTVSQMALDIPRDYGSGMWQNVKIVIRSDTI